MRRLLALLVLAGCTTQDEWMAAGESTTIAYYSGDFDIDRSSKPSWSGDQDGLILGVQPFAYRAMQRQADMNARAITEAAYAVRPPDPHMPATAHDFQPTEGPKRCSICKKTEAEVAGS